jgi:hypothetical protein
VEADVRHRVYIRDNRHSPGLQVRVAVTPIVGLPGLLNRGGRWQNVSSQMTTIKP